MRLVKTKEGNLFGRETMPVRPFDPIGSSPYAKSLLCQYLSEFIIENNKKLQSESTQFIVINPEKIINHLLIKAYKNNKC